jgi:hypothetical protein
MIPTTRSEAADAQLRDGFAEYDRKTSSAYGRRAAEADLRERQAR